MSENSRGEADRCLKPDAVPLPFLERQGDRMRLIVDGEPFIALAGEVHNSSASSLAYMERVWDCLSALNCNTALVPVYWELTEPEEGHFDFTLVDGLLEGARAHRLRLVLLWFGTWKNTFSSYAPAWVRRDLHRFPRAHTNPGVNTTCITAWSTEAREADTRAFAALMRHLKAVDETHRTVLMVQVQNEVGLLGSSRDHCPLAEAAYFQPVPQPLLSGIEARKHRLHPALSNAWNTAGACRSGTWSEVFGTAADEVFMAWHFAQYIEKIASCGKKNYLLPFFVNAWLVQHDAEPAGSYPSGGPVSRMIDIWSCAAPSIDFLAPDIYIQDFAGVCAEYASYGNPLFIPEARRDLTCAAHAFYAIAEHNALGFAPFGIDSIGIADEQNLAGAAADASRTIRTDADGTLLARSYRLLSDLMPLLTHHQSTGRMRGILQTSEDSQEIVLGNYRLRIEFTTALSDARAPAGGLVIALADDEYLAAGFSYRLTFDSLQPQERYAEVLEISEGHIEHGEWRPGRRLNGDEMEVRFDTCPSLRRIKLLQWPLKTTQVCSWTEPFG
ncbi:MAG: DUF5597 domain-containing protein [Janthinobacterium lividum]